MVITAVITGMGTAAIMNKRCWSSTCLNVTTALLLIAYVVGSSSFALWAADTRNLDAFAQCLADKNVTMYGSFLCPHCDDQKKLFGSSFRYVTYVECSVRGSRQIAFVCNMAQIQHTPTWVFANGDRLVGVQSLESLSTRTGCKLP